MKCKFCESERFYGHCESVPLEMDVVVDGNGNFKETVHKDVPEDIYEAEAPYGPFQCVGCGAMYRELVDDSNTASELGTEPLGYFAIDLTVRDIIEDTLRPAEVTIDLFMVIPTGLDLDFKDWDEEQLENWVEKELRMRIENYLTTRNGWKDTCKSDSWKGLYKSEFYFGWEDLKRSSFFKSGYEVYTKYHQVEHLKRLGDISLRVDPDQLAPDAAVTYFITWKSANGTQPNIKIGWTTVDFQTGDLNDDILRAELIPVSEIEYAAVLCGTIPLFPDNEEWKQKTMKQFQKHKGMFLLDPDEDYQRLLPIKTNNK